MHLWKTLLLHVPLWSITGRTCFVIVCGKKAQKTQKLFPVTHPIIVVGHCTYTHIRWPSGRNYGTSPIEWKLYRFVLCGRNSQNEFYSTGFNLLRGALICFNNKTYWKRAICSQSGIMMNTLVKFITVSNFELHSPNHTCASFVDDTLMLCGTETRSVQFLFDP